jgi:hypothetical protein
MKFGFGEALVVAAFLVGASGGIYFGLFSCGGLAWHSKAYLLLATSLIVGAVCVSNRHLRSLRLRAVFPFVIFAVFQVSQAAAAAFYPSPPKSIGEFFRLWVFTLEHGPC